MKKLTTEDFLKTITESQKPVVLELYSPFCPVCKKLAPIYEEIAQELGATYEFMQANVIDHPDIAKHFNMRVAPAILFIKDSAVVDKVYGCLEKNALIEKLKSAL